MTQMEELLRNAMQEIQDLRRRNEILGAKVEMIDLFALVLRTTPVLYSQGAAPDVVWALQKEINRIQKDESNRSKPALATI